MMITLREAEGLGNSPRLCNEVWAAWSMPYHLSQFMLLMLGTAPVFCRCTAP